MQIHLNFNFIKINININMNKIKLINKIIKYNDKINHVGGGKEEDAECEARINDIKYQFAEFFKNQQNIAEEELDRCKTDYENYIRSEEHTSELQSH